MTNKSDLSERIAGALTTLPSSADVARLLVEAEAEAVIADAAATEAKAKALDPKLTGAEVTSARAASQEAEFQRDRLTEAVKRLGGRLVEAQQHEVDDRARRIFCELSAKRDDLAAALGNMEPHVIQFAELLAKIEVCEHEIEVANRVQPPVGLARICPIVWDASPFLREVVGDGFALPNFATAARKRAAAVNVVPIARKVMRA
jgi:hypothetical protein